MPAFMLRRSGTGPLQFEGELLAFASGHDLWPKNKPRPPNRYHNIGLYRTHKGRYVVAVEFRCDTKFDDPYDAVEVLDSPQDVVEYLEDFDPLEGVRGWTLERHAEQDKRLREALTNNFERLVSLLLAGREEFAERV